MQTLETREISALIERLKALGFANRKRVRMYGELLQLTSDPEPHEHGFVIHAKSHPSGEEKHVMIPVSILQMLRQQGRVLRAA